MSIRSETPLTVIGIGCEGPAGLSADALDRIARAEVLAGGRRHLDAFPDWRGERLVIDADLDAFVEALRTRLPRPTVVLASGDPLFFGIGRVLLDAFPKQQLTFLPHVSSVQLAFARVKEPWHDAKVISLHGRPLEALRPALQAREARIALLTDARNDPAAIAAFVRAHGLGASYALWVCERLGGADERVTHGTAERPPEGPFDPLNVVVLLRTGTGTGPPPPDPLPLLGIPESSIPHRAERRGLITKREVRLLSIAALGLRPGDVVWDVGAGSGSVAIEAARLSPSLQVFAVEKDPALFDQLAATLAQFGLEGRITPVHGEAPEALANLPNPDAVFVGGSGGRLRDVIAHAADRLRPGGRLVINCIALETLARGWQWLDEAGLPPAATSVQVAHSKPLGPLHRLEPESPIFILRGEKVAAFLRPGGAGVNSQG